MAHAQAHVTQAIKEKRTILRDMRSNLLALDESVFNSDHNPTNLMMMNQDFMTDKQHAVSRLWRIRRFLRRQVGLPEDNSPLPKKIQRTIPPSELYDPETPHPVRPYDPTRIEELRRSPSFNKDNAGSDDYAEDTEESESASPMNQP
jgi:hypothetical protein